MTLDELLMEVRERRLLLISECELWPDPRITPAIQRAVRKHRKGLAILISWSSIQTCASRDWHSRLGEWSYNREYRRYTCDVCSRIRIAS
jgi:hypothetical protein